MAATAKRSDWLVGQKEIMAELKISTREQLKRYVALGLPGVLINGRWHVHRENLDMFLKRLSATPIVKQFRQGRRRHDGNFERKMNDHPGG